MLTTIGLQMLGWSADQNVPREPKSGNPEDPVVLVSFPRPGTSIISGTQFGGKLEVALRLAGIEHKGYKGDVTNKQHAAGSDLFETS